MYKYILENYYENQPMEFIFTPKDNGFEAKFSINNKELSCEDKYGDISDIDICLDYFENFILIYKEFFKINHRKTYNQQTTAIYFFDYQNITDVKRILDLFVAYLHDNTLCNVCDDDEIFFPPTELFHIVDCNK